MVRLVPEYRGGRAGCCYGESTTEVARSLSRGPLLSSA